jgi:RNA-directed DNA polymerase
MIGLRSWQALHREQAARIWLATEGTDMRCGFSTPGSPSVKNESAKRGRSHSKRFKQRIREITRRAKGVSIQTTIKELASYMRGWRSYFGFCETPEVLVYFTRWVRLRLRAAL